MGDAVSLTRGTTQIKRGGRHILPLLFLLAWLPSCTAVGQGVFTLSGKCPSRVGKRVTLTVYDGDTTKHTFTRRVKNGSFTFNGEIAAPCAAQLSFGGHGSLYIFLEATEMTVEINPDNLEHSPVSGSRTNSRYRYAMENTADNRSLADFVAANRQSSLASFVLFRQMRNLEPYTLQKIYAQLDSTAAKCYHYHAIGRYLSDVAALTAGQPLPDFTITNRGKSCKMSELLRRDTATLILVGAAWCDICQRTLDQAREACGDTVTLVYIDLAREPQGWDAPCVERLDIPHLPYIILLDPNGNIAARDVRTWELARHIQAATANRPPK